MTVELQTGPQDVSNLVARVNDFINQTNATLGTTSPLPLLTGPQDRRNFIDADGKPVAPTVAIAAYGTPTVALIGNASAFLTNQGTGGAFTLTGSLTNAATSPSD